MTSRRALCRFFTTIGGIAAAQLLTAGLQAQDNDEDFPPGLLATYSVGNSSVSRVDPAIQFAWGSAVPDARLPAGQFSARWTGMILLREPGRHTFHAMVNGHVTVEIDEQTVLSSSVDGFNSGNEVSLNAGDHVISVQYTAPQPPVKNARLNLLWSSERFTLEPVSADILFREDSSPGLNAQRDGQRLTDALRCAACHQPDSGATLKAPSLERVRGSHIGDSLIDRLMNPGHVVSNSHMPGFGLTRNEASAVAAFLLSISKKPQKPNSLQIREGDNAKGTRLLNSLGCVACHQVRAQQVPLATPYDAPDLTHVAERRSADWLNRWLQAPDSLNANHRMPIFELSNEERWQIVAALTGGRSDEVHSSETSLLDVDDQTIAHGRRIVEESHCAACHEIPGTKSETGFPAALTRSSLAAEKSSCLQSAKAGHRPARQPLFRTTASARSSMEAWLATVDRPLQQVSVADRGSLLLRQNGCVACHDRDSGRGLSMIAAQLQNSHPDLKGQSEGLIPPSLTAVGDRIRKDSLKKAVAGDQPARRLPWLLVRMPKFRHSDAERAALVTHLIAADRIPDEADGARKDVLVHLEQENAAPASPQELLLANQLVGAGGFNCVACHQAGSFQPRNVALGTRGSDIMTMGARIRPRFFQRWMKNPIRVVRGIEMPAIKKAMPGIHGDSLPKQIATIWRGLSDPRFTPPTVTSRFEQVVDVAPGGAPRIIRDVFTMGEGKVRESVARAIAIGFDNGHNVLFDLDTMQIRQWTIGELARQRTEGKSWYWDMPGTNVATITTPDLQLHAVDESTGRKLAPLADEGRQVELIDYQIVDNGVELTCRIRFASGDALPVTDDEQPHFTQPIWEQADLIHATATFRHRFQPLTVSPSKQGWIHTVRLLECTPQITVSAASTPQWEVSTSDIGFSVPQHEQTTELSGDRTHTIGFVAEATVKLPAAKPVPVVMNSADPVTTTPGFSGRRLPIDQSLMPTAITWLSDGSMAFTSLKGHVWTARDTDGDGLEDATQLLEEGLAAPFGIAADGNDLLVAHKPEVLRLVSGRDGQISRREVMASGWGYNDNYHDWTTGLVRDREGNLFVGLGSDYSQKDRPENQDRWRGGIIKIDPSGVVTPVAMSFRYPMGLAFDAQGNLWATDNQGVQNTFNEINHILTGKHYGVPSTHQPTDGLQHEVAGLMIPHPWVRSVNSILFLPHDFPIPSLRGHGIGCEYDNQMLIRFTVQNVNGTLQGATYNFSRPNQGGGGHNFIGPICSAISPDGALYIGSIWDSGWQGGRNNGGMTRLDPSPEGLPNGIREVTATRRGFEVAFFKPITESAAIDPGNWSIQGYTRVWGGSYATPDSGRHTLNATGLQVSADGRRVSFQVEELKPGHVYDIVVNDALAATGELWPTEAHYSMKTVP